MVHRGVTLAETRDLSIFGLSPMERNKAEWVRKIKNMVIDKTASYFLARTSHDLDSRSNGSIGESGNMDSMNTFMYKVRLSYLAAVNILSG